MHINRAQLAAGQTMGEGEMVVRLQQGNANGAVYALLGHLVDAASGMPTSS
jgi:hypothetical protein